MPLPQPPDTRTPRPLALPTAAALLATALLLLAAGAHADAERAPAPDTRLRRTHGELVALDADRSVLILREGDARVDYRVVLEGSATRRTAATLNAQPVLLPAIPEGARVIVYWTPDPLDPAVRHAQRVDAPRAQDAPAEPEAEASTYGDW